MVRGLFDGWHLPLLIIVLVLLFGAKRLPDAARGLGRSLRIFKSEIEGLNTDSASPAAPAALDQNHQASITEPLQTPPQSTPQANSGP